MHDEDNDGRFPDESPVEVRYPRSKQEEHGDRGWVRAVAGSARSSSSRRALIRSGSHRDSGKKNSSHCTDR